MNLRSVLEIVVTELAEKSVRRAESRTSRVLYFICLDYRYFILLLCHEEDSEYNRVLIGHYWEINKFYYVQMKKKMPVRYPSGSCSHNCWMSPA